MPEIACHRKFVGLFEQSYNKKRVVMHRASIADLYSVLVCRLATTRDAENGCIAHRKIYSQLAVAEIDAALAHFELFCRNRMCIWVAAI